MYCSLCADKLALPPWLHALRYQLALNNACQKVHAYTILEYERTKQHCPTRILLTY